MNSPRHPESLVLSRDVEALRVPDGQPATLRAGERIRVTQALGGTYTVLVQGNLFRVARHNADALGRAGEADPQPAAAADELREEQIWQALRSCYDPEIPVNLVDLGLIYDCALEPLPDGGHSVAIKMTLTAPGCGMGPVIAADVDRRVRQIPGVRQASVELVWDPPWSQAMMSEAARLQLGLL